MECSNKIVLIYPQSQNFDSNFAPVSLLYIAEPLLKSKYKVEILDQRYENDFLTALDIVLKQNPLCIGISCMTGTQINEVIKICNFVKAKKNVPIIVGGPQPTVFPKQTLSEQNIDYIILGAAETSFLKLVDKLNKNRTDFNKISGLGYKKKGKMVIINPHNTPDSHSDIPYHLIKKYANRFNLMFPIQTSFGCINKCGFCAVNLMYKKYFYVAPEITINNLSKILKMQINLPILFIDNDLLCNKKKIQTLFQMCEKRHMHFSWTCSSRIDTVFNLDEKFFIELRNKGLQQIHFGIESGSVRILELIHKGITPKMVLIVNLKLKKLGIQPGYNFIIGIPTETKSDIQKTFNLIKLIKKINSKAIIWKINHYIPYPGTLLYKLALAEGFIPPKNLAECANLYCYNVDYPVSYDFKL